MGFNFEEDAGQSTSRVVREQKFPEPGAREESLRGLADFLASNEVQQFARQAGVQDILDQAFTGLAPGLARDATAQSEIFETPEARQGLAALLRGEVPEQALANINAIAEGSQRAIDQFATEGIGQIRGATEGRGLRTGDAPIQQQFGSLGAEVLRQRSAVEAERGRQLLTFPQEQAAFQQGLRQQAFANRTGLLQGGTQLGLGLASNTVGNVGNFLTGEERFRFGRGTVNQRSIGRSAGGSQDRLAQNVAIGSAIGGASTQGVSTASGGLL